MSSEPTRIISPRITQRGQNAPEQHAMLMGGRDSQVAEDQGDDAEVVDAERFFDHVSGQERRRGDPTVGLRVREVHAEPVLLVAEVDEQREQERQPDPGAAPQQRFANGNHVRFAVEHAQIERQQDHDETDETDPQPFHDHLREPRRTEAASIERRPVT